MTVFSPWLACTSTEGRERERERERERVVVVREFRRLSAFFLGKDPTSLPATSSKFPHFVKHPREASHEGFPVRHRCDAVVRSISISPSGVRICVGFV